MIELLHGSGDGAFVVVGVKALVAAFLAVLFLQSGIDKIADRRGNLLWLKEHFSRSPFAAVVPALLAVITVVEVVAGALSAAGVAGLLIYGNPGLAILGAMTSALALLLLFLGQRLAKDYEGAAVLAGYFTLVLVGIYLLRL